jgi:hypothetical protein
MTWEEGMSLPGSYQVGLGAKLLQQFEWWRFEPHPEWVTPRGTTLLEPRNQVRGFNVREEWDNKNGDFYLPYAAGIPGKVRLIYIPYFTMYSHWNGPPTILGLEPGVRYHSYYWEPSLGIKIDLGGVERPSPGKKVFEDTFQNENSSEWIDYGATTVKEIGHLIATDVTLSVLKAVDESDIVAHVAAQSGADAGLILRYHDEGDYLLATYSHTDHAVYFLDRRGGLDGPTLGRASVPDIGSDIQLSAEVHGPWAIVSISDGRSTYTSPIVSVSNSTAGKVGLSHRSNGTQTFTDFQVLKSPAEPPTQERERRLYDARGTYRGELSGPGYERFGQDAAVLLDAYRPPMFPTTQDWILVLEATTETRRVQ